VKAAIAVISFILSNATKFSVDADSLSNELQQLGLPKGSFIQFSILLLEPINNNKIAPSNLVTPPPVEDPPIGAARRNSCSTVFARWCTPSRCDSLDPSHSPSQIAARLVQPFLHGQCNSLPICYIAPPHPPKFPLAMVES